MTDYQKTLVILGIRGIPAVHGGFETFAENLSFYLAERNWKVVVYCQQHGRKSISRSEWRSVTLVHVPVNFTGAIASMFFDLKSILHSLRVEGVVLTLGYNTAIFNIFHRIMGKTNIINMDGIEWKRSKWGRLARVWLWINERIACRVASHVVADNPAIESHLAPHLSRDKITMIPYGAEQISIADENALADLGLEKNRYAIFVGRPEPENSILEMVEAFSEIERGIKLVVLGDFNPSSRPYHREVLNAASAEVIFPGAIYDQDKLAALRFFTRFYFHGHQVGGTNPSLVEALGAGNAVIAHDNPFNRWVSKDAALYFSSVSEASSAISRLITDNDKLSELKSFARTNFEKNFRWQNIFHEYERLISGYLKE